MRESISERFWRKVDIGDDCWEWRASLNMQGYGQISRSRIEGPILAHRLSFQLARGAELAPSECVLHRCDNPLCVRPSHLFIGDRKINYSDAKAKDRHARGERHGAAKLTAEAVRAIRKDARPCPSIALDYGMSTSVIVGVKARKGWRHVE